MQFFLFSYIKCNKDILYLIIQLYKLLNIFSVEKKTEKAWERGKAEGTYGSILEVSQLMHTLLLY